MNDWCRKLVLVLALAAMPLQGAAATLAVLLCHGDAQMHVAHDHGGHDHGSAPEGHHGAPPADESAGHSAAFHLCCNVSVSAPPAMMMPPVAPDFPAGALVPDPLQDLHVPELPQRPPLA